MSITAFRTPIAHASVWKGQDIRQQRSQWTSTYTEAELQEAHYLARTISAQYADVQHIPVDTLDVPLLRAKVGAISDQLEEGIGFHVLKGLPVQEWTEAQSRTVFWVLARLAGFPESQDKAGSVMHSVRDKGKSVQQDSSARGYETNNELTFHNDGSDAVMLLCLNTAISGGDSKLVSAGYIFNEVLRQAPELAEVLQQPFHFDTREQHPDGRKIQSVPIFNYHAGKLSTLYKRQYLLTAQRFAEVPRLSEAQLAALELVERIANDPANHLTFRLDKGDISFANNYTVLHSRTAYEDHEALEDKRHLLRTWLTLNNGRALPPVFAQTREFMHSYRRRHGPDQHKQAA